MRSFSMNLLRIKVFLIHKVIFIYIVTWICGVHNCFSKEKTKQKNSLWLYFFKELDCNQRQESFV